MAHNNKWMVLKKSQQSKKTQKNQVEREMSKQNEKYFQRNVQNVLMKII